MLDLIITFLIKAMFIIILFLGLILIIIGSAYVIYEACLFWWNVDLKDKDFLIKNKLKSIKNKCVSFVEYSTKSKLNNKEI